MIERLVREFGELRVDTSDWPILLMEFPEMRVTVGSPGTELEFAL